MSCQEQPVAIVNQEASGMGGDRKTSALFLYLVASLISRVRVALDTSSAIDDGKDPAVVK